MSISLEVENEIINFVNTLKEKHRIRKPINIIITTDTVKINPDTSVKDPKYTLAYGIGFQDGRNDLHNEIYNKSYDYHKRTNKNKKYQ